MKSAKQILLVPAVLVGLALNSYSAVVADNTWLSGTRTNWSLPGGESPWFSDSSSDFNLAVLADYFGAGNNALCVTNYPAGSTRNFWTYFTTNAPELTVPFGDGSTTNPATGTTNKVYGHPVEIDVGEKLVVTLVLSPSTVMPNGNSWVRFGLLNYEDASGYGRPARDNNNWKDSGTNVTGYRFDVAMYQTFAADPGQTTLAFRARTNLNELADSREPLGKSGPWFELGSGARMTNGTGFQNDLEYTLQFSVLRYAGSNVLSSKVSGGSLDLENSEVDITGSNYFRFDTFAMRTDVGAAGAYLYFLRQFKVETLPINAVGPPFSITAQGFIAPDQFWLTWDSAAGQVYQVQSRAVLGSGDWITNATLTAASASTSWTNIGLSGVSQRFYRVVNAP